MSVVLRVFLVLVAIAVLTVILRKLRKSEIQVIDSVFWFFFAASFVVLAVFPQIAFVCSGALGFESPSNFIFLYVIGVLMLREFSLTEKLARQRMKLNALVQEIAIKDNGMREEIVEKKQ